MDYFGPTTNISNATNYYSIYNTTYTTTVTNIIEDHTLAIEQIILIAIWVCCCYCCCCLLDRDNLRSNQTSYVSNVHYDTESDSDSDSDSDSIADTHFKNKSVVIDIPEDIFESVELSDTDHEICCICLDNLEDNAIKINKCSHIYHKECIEEWFKINQTCPICRTDTIV